MSLIGKHCVLELYDCDSGRLNDRDFLVRTLRSVAQEAGATWLDGVSHAFEPQGVTAVGLLAESHISLHTWPEHGYAAADVFTCGDSTDPALACRLLADAVGARDYSLRIIPRAGRLNDPSLGDVVEADAATV